MIIGCLREIKNNENRVGLTPEGIKKLTSAGHQVIIQETAVNGAGYHDYECQEAGAILEKEPIKIAEKCDILVKVKEPLPEEYYLFEKMQDKTIFTYFHLSGVDPSLTKHLLKHNITAVAYETVQDKKGRLPLELLVLPPFNTLLSYCRSNMEAEVGLAVLCLAPNKPIS